MQSCAPVWVYKAKKAIKEKLWAQILTGNIGQMHFQKVYISIRK